MRIAALTRYDDLGASLRVRFAQYAPVMTRLAYIPHLWRRNISQGLLGIEWVV